MSSLPSPSFRNVWRVLLSSPSSGEAIDQALSFLQSEQCHYNDLPLPPPESHLSSHERINLDAIRRALTDEHVCYGWDAWSDTDSDDGDGVHDDGDGDAHHSLGTGHMKHVPAHKPSPSKHNINLPISIQAGSQSENSSSSSASVSSAPALTSEMSVQGASPRTSPKPLPTSTSNQTSEPLAQTNPHNPTAEHLKHANVLKTWAKMSPHTPPPRQALHQVTQSLCLPKLLETIVEPNCTPPFRAVILSTLTENIPTSMAQSVQTSLILPYLQTLTTPAIREMLIAITSFSTRHWRPAVKLFTYFTSNGKINGPVAEVLNRVVSAIPSQAAFQILQLVATATWTDQSIPLIETLITRCNTADALPSVLLPSLDRNVTTLEKSVRFGKLLFTIVKDIPAIRLSHKQSMESICQRSKVFLAKRALALLRQQPNETK